MTSSNATICLITKWISVACIFFHLHVIRIWCCVFTIEQLLVCYHMCKYTVITVRDTQCKVAPMYFFCYFFPLVENVSSLAVFTAIWNLKEITCEIILRHGCWQQSDFQCDANKLPGLSTRSDLYRRTQKDGRVQHTCTEWLFHHAEVWFWDTATLNPREEQCSSKEVTNYRVWFFNKIASAGGTQS